MPSLNWSIEPWYVDGLCLTDYAVGLYAITGDGLPPRRGSNITVPYNTGQEWRPKVLSAQDRTLVAWISDMRGDGLLDADNYVQMAQARENREAFLRVFAKTDAMLEIQRIVKKFVGGLPTDVTLTAHAEASNAAGFETVENFNTLVYASVDLTFPDPRWYGAALAASVNVGASATIDNVGTVPAEDMTIVLHGPMANPVLTNTTGGLNHSVTVGSDIAAGDWITLNVGRFTAIRGSDGANVIGAVSRNGGRRWMRLLRGPNTLSLAAASGTGHAAITFDPPYLL